jgi:hypothetical protein
LFVDNVDSVTLSSKVFIAKERCKQSADSLSQDEYAYICNQASF